MVLLRCAHDGSADLTFDEALRNRKQEVEPEKAGHAQNVRSDTARQAFLGKSFPNGATSAEANAKAQPIRNGA